MKPVCTALIIMTAWLSLWTSDVFAQTYAFVPNSGDDTVSIVDLTDNTVSATITLETGSSPYAAGVSPDGNTAYIVNTGTNTVTVLDTTQIGDVDNIIETTISVGQEPRGIAVGPDGDYVYVTNYGGDSLTIINCDTFATSTVEDLGAGPWGVVADPDGDHVYVICHLDDSLAVVSASDVFTMPDIGDGPLDVTLDDDHDRLYITCNGDDTVVVYEITYDDDDFDVVAYDTISVEDSPWGVTLDPDNEYLYVSHDSLSGSVLIVAADDYDDKRMIDLDAELRGIRSAANGDTMVVSGYGSNTIYMIDIDTQALVDSLSEFSAPVAMGDFIGGWGPEAPTGLDDSSVGEDNVTLVWEDNSWDELGFKIQRRNYDDDDFETIATVDNNVTQYTDTGLASDETYVYQIVAYNEAGDSSPTDSLYITTESDSEACFISSLGSLDGVHKTGPGGLMVFALVVCIGRFLLQSTFKQHRSRLPR